LTDLIAGKKEVEKIQYLSEDQMISSVLSQNGEAIIYFSKDTGQAMQTDLFGNDKKTLFSEKNTGLAEVFWSADKSKAILKVKNYQGKFVFSLYDLSSNQIIPIDKEIDDVKWQISANKIIYKYYDAKIKKRSLNVSDPDGANWKKIADLPYRFVSIAQIPKTNLISFWNSGDAHAETIFHSVSVMGENEKNVITGGFFGADYLWNNSGEYALISYSDSKDKSKIRLAILDYVQGGQKNLDVPTLVSKCVWSKDNNTVYYALPGEVPEKSVLPNDYKEKKFNTADTFWKINIQTGEKTRVVEPAEMKEKYDASQMFLNQDESALFFLNRINEKLYKINL
jgi:hypothetical protein